LGYLLILEAKRVDLKKPKKYSDLRKLKQDATGPLNPGENYYVHPLPLFPLKVKDKRYRYKEFHLDVYNLRCTCEDQIAKREEYQDRDIRKLCKHLYYKISSSWLKQYVDSLSLELLKNSVFFGPEHLYKYEYKKSLIILGFRSETEWVNVYAPNIHHPEEHKRYSFNPSTKRWSYNSKPEYGILFEDVIHRLIKNTLTFEHHGLKKGYLNG